MAEGKNSGASGYEQRTGLRADFAFDVAAGQAVQSGLSGNSAGATMQGGNMKTGVVVPDAQPVVGWGGLDSAIDRIMAPRVAAVQKDNFWKGVVAARSGQSIKEIVESDSPLSKIFGPSSYVQGAQYYTSSAKLTDYNISLMRNSEEIANLPPDEVGKRLNAEVALVETGDPGTDALMHQTMIEAVQPTLNVIAKTRYGLQQKAASDAFFKNATAATGLLQEIGKKRREFTATDEDVNMSMAHVANSLTKPDGMDTETYKAMLPQIARRWAEEGNWYGVQVLERSGALNFMPLDEGIKLRDRLDKDRKQHAAASRHKYAPELSDLQASVNAGAMTPATFVERVTKLQDRFSTETGNTEPLMPWMEQENYLVKGRGNWWKAKEENARATVAASKAAATQEEKDRADAREQATIGAMVQTGTLGENNGIDSIKKEAAFVKAYEDYLPEERHQIMVSNFINSKYVNSTIANRLQSVYRATTEGEYTPAAEAAFQDWKQLQSSHRGAATAAAYYSEEQSIRLAKFDALTSGGVEKPLAYRQAFQEPLTEAVDWTRKYGNDYEIKTAVRDSLESVFPGRMALDETSERYIAARVKPAIETYQSNTGYTVPQSARQALNGMSQTLEVFGGKAWYKDTNQRPLLAMIKNTNRPDDEFNYDAVPPKMLDEVFAKVVEKGMAAVGGKGAETQVVTRLADSNGKAVFAVVATKDDGTRKVFQFDSDEVSKEYTGYITSGARYSTNWEYGPKNTFLTEEGQKKATKAYYGWK